MAHFTQEELVQFLYNELPAGTKARMEAALESDWALREELENLKSSQLALNEIKMLSPRNETLENILRYAEKSADVSSHA